MTIARSVAAVSVTFCLLCWLPRHEPDCPGPGCPATYIDEGSGGLRGIGGPGPGVGGGGGGVGGGIGGGGAGWDSISSGNDSGPRSDNRERNR